MKKLLVLIFLLLPCAAHAACTSPSGVAGEIAYGSNNVMAYCNGTNWISMGSMYSGGGGISLAGRTITSGTSDTASTSDYEIRWCLSSGAVTTETIPACNGTNNGLVVVVTDECGTFSGTNTMTVSAASGTILTPNTSLVMNTPYQSVTFHCDGAKTNYTVN